MNATISTAALTVVAIIFLVIAAIISKKFAAKRIKESAQAGLWFVDSMEAAIVLFEKNAEQLCDAAAAGITLSEYQKGIADIYVELNDLDEYQENWPARDEDLLKGFSGLDLPIALKALANLRKRLSDCREKLKQCIQDQLIKHNIQGFEN